MAIDKSFYKALLRLSLPIAAQNVLTFLIGLADNIMVSTLGETAVSGVFVANQITNLLQMLTLGLGAALTVLAAQYWGKKDVRSVRSIVGVGFRLAVGAGLILFLLVRLFPEKAIGLFTDDPGALQAGAEYVRIVSFTYLPFCVTALLIAAMRCVETVRLGTRTALVSLIVNVTLNYLLIFGKLGFPRLGLAGAAWATLISRLAALAISVVYVAHFDRKLLLTLQDLFSLRSPFTHDFFRYGLPVIAGDLLWGVNMAVQGSIIGHLDTTSIAAVSVANTFFSILSVGLYGTRDASSILIGKTVGSGDRDRVILYSRRLQIVYVLLGLLTGAVVLSSQLLIPLLYRGLDGATIDMAKQLLRVLSVTVVGTAYQMSVLTGIVRAGGATRFVLVNDLIFVWLIVIPSAAVAAFALHAPTWVVFACLKCDQILKCAVAYIKVNRFRWIRDLTQPKLEKEKTI